MPTEIEILNILLQKSRICKDNDCGNTVKTDMHSFCDFHECNDPSCKSRVKTGTIYCERHESEYTS